MTGIQPPRHAIVLGTGGIHGDRLRRLAGLPRRMPTTSGHRDPLIERPGLVEDDYYRFRNQPTAGDGGSCNLGLPAATTRPGTAQSGWSSGPDRTGRPDKPEGTPPS
jgi:hypothetical protein